MDNIQKCISLIKEKKFNESRIALINLDQTIQLDIKYNLLGIIDSELKNYSESIQNFNKALEISPNNVIYNFNLGLALGKNLNTLKSIKQLKICIKKNHQISDCLVSISDQLINKNKIKLALNFLLKADKKDYKVNHNTAFIYNALGQKNLANKYILEAIKISPQNTDVLFLYAEILKKEFRFDDAIRIYKKIIKINPNHELAYLNLANTFGKIDHYYEAIKNYKSVLKINKNNVDALFFLTQIYLKKKIINKVELQNFDKRFNLQYDSVKNLYNNLNKKWNGEFINNLLIWGEQGVGDHIFFSKYLEEACSFSKKIIFQTDGRLIKLFKNFFTYNNILNVEIQDINKKIDHWDAHIPLGSLMKVLNKKPFTNKHFKKILRADIDLINTFNTSVNKKYLNIGISWKSLNKEEIHRNIELSIIFNYLNKIPNIKFFNLQFGLHENEIQNAKNDQKLIFYDNIDYKNDFNSVAAIIENLDYVVSIQNTVAHLSCALQKKTLLLAPLGARWYWGSNDIDEWYGSAKIFRQTKLLDWSNPLKMLVNFINYDKKK